MVNRISWDDGEGWENLQYLFHSHNANGIITKIIQLQDK